MLGYLALAEWRRRTAYQRLRNRALSVVVALVLMSSFGVSAGYDDRYRYKLELNKAPRVCPHMLKVYNCHFQRPWKLDVLSPQVYGADSKYAFPKLPGVQHESNFTFAMRYSRFPTTNEFEEIQWREGRYISADPEGRLAVERPMLVAEADIDHDGGPDVLVKAEFMSAYTVWAGWNAYGGNDQIFVFTREAFATLLRNPEVRPTYTQFVQSRARLLIFGDAMRPFMLNGVALLAVYQQVWRDRPSSKSPANPDIEYIRILRYLRGTAVPRDGEAKIESEELCRFRMQIRK